MPAPDYSAALSATYGGLSLPLWDYVVNETPVLKEGVGRIFTKVVVKLECRISGSGSASDFATQVATAMTAVRQDGQNLIILGLAGQPEYVVLAAQSMEGGPHVTVDSVESGESAMTKIVKMTLTSSQFDPKSGPTNSWKATVDTAANGLHTYTRVGDVIGPNASDYFVNVALPQARAAYPWPKYVFTSTAESSLDNNLAKTSYSIRAVQLNEDLPASQNGAAQASQAVDGEMTFHVDRDEQHRKLTTFEHDYVVVGDEISLLGELRQLASNFGKRIILREKYQTTSIKENRLRASFVVLEGANGSPLMNWTETLTMKAAEDGWDVHTYPGAAPVVVRRPQNVPRVSQSGQAVGAGQFKRPPDWLYPTFLGGAAEITVADENEVEKKTSWKAESFPALPNGDPDETFDPANAAVTKLARKAQAETYFGQPAGGGA